MEDLRYPIGRFQKPAGNFPEEREGFIKQIKELPKKFTAAAATLSIEQLNTPYRPDGWTLQQVIHHVPDSHFNGLVRFKLALTEDNPTVKPYSEADWANLADSELDIQNSLQMLFLIHNKWVSILESMSDSDFDRTFNHPEFNKSFPLWEYLALYAWHGDHHLAHITTTKESHGWN